METDVFIAGAGLAGSIAALSYSKAGRNVIVADPFIYSDNPQVDYRTTAYLQPAKLFLESLGIWEAIEDSAMPLEVMKIIDSSSVKNGDIIKSQKEFKSAEISDLPFGWNVKNSLMRTALKRLIDQQSNCKLITASSAIDLVCRDSMAYVKLSSGKTVKAKLVIAADGRNSILRQKAGISIKTQRFGQKALAFAVTHATPHKNISTEIHNSGGPFTLVPLPDNNGKPSSAIVWMENGEKAKRLMEMETKSFEREMTVRSCNILGPLKLASKRSLWPIISQIADRLYSQRLALIGETAHVVPPIGAQGLNMSIKDIKFLNNLDQKYPDQLGSIDILNEYQKNRIFDIRQRVVGVSALNRISISSNKLVQNVRAFGLENFFQVPAIKHATMKLGMGNR
ncbi:MAG: FAD-dependent monooxygenase [Paracoccaceae bacterium]